MSMKTKLIAAEIVGEFHWGYSIRAVSESAAAHPYPVPPPSTLIGALSYSFSRLRNLGECISIVKDNKIFLASRALMFSNIITWATFGFKRNEKSNKIVLAQEYSDPIRLFRLIYQRGVRHEKKYKNMWFGVAAHGKVYYPSGQFKIIYLLREDMLLKNIGESEDIRKIIRKACFSINRLGSRESIVSVEQVKITNNIDVIDPPENTSFYFPLRLVKFYATERGELVKLPVFDRKSLERGFIFRGDKLWIGDHESFIVPTIEWGFKGPGKIRVERLSEKGRLIKMFFDDRSSETIVVSGEAIGDKD